ncbi:RNA polymerase sigma-70 factor [Fulvivirga sp. M361]|uniref:RNA polymerase sigma factor n=1 Tax=Fulvivirga sp. M361 TaxID=2594266 RepID=UPI00117B3B49|nr:RNA polymerase sigma-70 factor [Fulvivirga sp. M361]TRX59228.1 RNA polymerase sigma-70 factor [Fulvivirga sp. M361]
MRTENESRLIILLKKGDSRAFEQIYNLYWESLYAIGCNRLQSQAEVEDVIQELFTGIWNKRQSLEIRDGLKVYIYTAMKYKVIDHIRKRKLNQVNLDHAQSTCWVSTNNTSEVLSFNELYGRFKVGIENLPDRCKLVFKMSREMDMSSDEIAKELDLSKRTVETQIYKALKYLRKDLSDYTVIFLIALLSLFF